MLLFSCTSESSLFDIDSSSGWISTKTDLVYNTASSYSLTVTGTDAAGHTDTAAVIITVTEGK